MKIIASETDLEEKNHLHIGSPGSIERVKLQYPKLITILKDMKSNGNDISQAYEKIKEAGIPFPSTESASLLIVSGFTTQQHPMYDEETLKAMEAMYQYVKKNGIQALKQLTNEIEQKTIPNKTKNI